MPNRLATIVRYGLALILLPAAAHAAIDFPIEYSGRWRLTVTVTNSYGSGLCTDDAAASMTLQSDGTAIWQAAEITAYLQTPTGQRPTCEIRASGKTVTATGTHDKVSRFSLPSGSSLPPITGSFDADHIRAEYRVGEHTLMEWDLPAVSHLVAIDPDPTVGFDFHKSILEGKGFKFVFRDPHGRDHLDFGTLKILVGGVDTTQHVLTRLTRGIVPFTEENPDSRTKAFRLRPDPNKLMQGHDVFAIPYNGDWRIELHICDKGGTCFGKVYDKVYFGPFVSASKIYRVLDGRCADPPEPYLRLRSITVGNVGIDALSSAVYVGLTNASDGLWTYSMGDVGSPLPQFGWFQGSIQPYVPVVPLASGFMHTYDALDIPNWISVGAGSGQPSLRRAPFPGGDFTLALAALDPATGAYRRDEHPVTMCDR